MIVYLKNRNKFSWISIIMGVVFFMGISFRAPLANDIKVNSTLDYSSIKIIDSLIQEGENLIRHFPEKSAQNALMALQYAQDINDLQKIGETYLLLSDANFYLGMFDVALKYSNEAELIFKKIDQPLLLARSLNLTGSVYLRFPDSEKSLTFFQRALQIYDSLNYKTGSAESLNLIGNLYNTWEEYEKAMDYYNQSMHIREALKDTNAVASSLNNIALIFIEWEQYDTAIACFKKSIECKLLRQNDNIGLGNAYNNLGDAYLKLKNYDAALKNHLLALNYRKISRNKRGIGSSLNNIGNIYYDMGDYHKAIEYYTQGLAIDVTETNYRNYEGLAMVYSQLNDFKQAFTFYYKYSQLRDSLFNSQRYQQIAMMETIFKTSQKDQEVLLLQKENEIKNLQINRIRIGSFIIAGVIILIIFITILWIRNNKIKAMHENLKLEQKLFRVQMNPHFIFNSLIAIQNYILKNKSILAAEYLSGFSKLMRDILNNSMKELVSLESEVKFLKQYLILQQLRFENKFDFSIIVADDIEQEETAMPPMLAQPFIENSIEHGIANMPGEGIVKINFTLKNGYLFFEVIDNGVGLENSKNPQFRKHKSIATELTKKRINNLNKQRKKKFILHIIDLQNEEIGKSGTKVIFQMPLIYI